MVTVRSLIVVNERSLVKAAFLFLCGVISGNDSGKFEAVHIGMICPENTVNFNGFGDFMMVQKDEFYFRGVFFCVKKDNISDIEDMIWILSKLENILPVKEKTWE